MGRLTTAQKEYLAAGHRIRQQWSIAAPTSAGGTSLVPYQFEVMTHGDAVGAASDNNRVVRAGSRKVAVWNPHPQESSRASAPRYQIEVRNDDGYFYPGSGSAFNPLGIYNAAPEECFLVHSVSVATDPAGVTYTPIGFLSYTGRIIEVIYTEQSTPDGQPDGSRAVIRTEQAGAWDVLRHVFTEEDGSAQSVNIDGLGTFVEWTVT